MSFLKLNPLSATDPQTAGLTIANAQAKTTPVDADAVGLMDSAAANILKLLSMANLSKYVRTGITTAPAAGQIGEVLKSSVTRGSAVTCTNAQYGNITSLSITAGTWTLSGSVGMTGSSTNATVAGAYGTATGNSSTGVLQEDGYVGTIQNISSVDWNAAIAPVDITLASTTTYYLKSYFAGSGTCTAYGTLRATRKA